MSNQQNKISDERTAFHKERSILLTGLRELEDIERRAIFLRFWRPYSISQIAGELKVSWDVADQIINRSIKKLRGYFIEQKLIHPPESRRIYEEKR